MFPLTSICYDGKDLEEPLGGVPTVSLVLQVTTLAIYVFTKCPTVYIWNFLKSQIVNPLKFRLS